MSRALVQTIADLAALAGPEVVVARDPAALARLQRARRLPPTYVEFLRAHSSHDFVDAGLVCAGRPVWLTPVDTLEEIAGCYAEHMPGLWQVCAVEPGGCYVLDLHRLHTDDCPVLHVTEDGLQREVARGFLEFLRRIVRDTRALRQVREDMPERPAAPRPGFTLGAFARAALAFALVFFFAAVLGALR